MASKPPYDAAAHADYHAGAGGKPITKAAVALALAAAVAVATPLVGTLEGYSSKPYADKLAGGLMTVCFGETRVQMRQYTRGECEAMLSDGVGEFAIGVAKRNPELVGHSQQWAAATSLSYNIGLAAYARSTVARRFSAGDWRGACDAFLSWSYAGGKQIKGLLNRRKAERDICLRGL